MSRPLLVLVESASSDATERSRHNVPRNVAARMKRDDRGYDPIAAQLRARRRRLMIHVRRGAPVPEILAAA